MEHIAGVLVGVVFVLCILFAQEEETALARLFWWLMAYLTVALHMVFAGIATGIEFML